MRKDYTTDEKERKVFLFAMIILGIAIGFWLGMQIVRAEEEKPLACWIMCKPGPGNQVFIREKPDKGSKDVGFLEAGDEFYTDGKCRNGFVHAVGIGEAGDGWIYSGYVVTEKPELVCENYYCVARSRAACRRWVEGPQIAGRLGWIHNGTTVTVFLRNSEWSVTSRGYIRSEWLEVDP